MLHCYLRLPIAAVVLVLVVLDCVHKDPQCTVVPNFSEIEQSMAYRNFPASGAHNALAYQISTQHVAELFVS